MESREGITLNDTIEYAPIYDIRQRNENVVNTPDGEIGLSVDTSKGGIYFSSSDIVRASSGPSSQPAPAKSSCPDKKQSTELYDENMYSLPSNPLPESECSSRVSSSPSLKGKSKYVDGWNCSTGSLIALTLSTFLLVAGIFVAIYVPMSGKDQKG